MSLPRSENSRTWQEIPADGAAVSYGLYLMRHGQSVWNVARRLQGQAHSPQLTRTGIRQVQQSADKLAANLHQHVLNNLARNPAAPQTADESAGSPGIHIISSDQMRARQSAQIVAASLSATRPPHSQQPQNQQLQSKHPGQPFVPQEIIMSCDTRLREQCVGRMQGSFTSDLTAEPTPPGQHTADVRWGGGESLADVADRLQTFIAEITTEHKHRDRPAATIVVSHGITLAVMAALLDGKTHYDVSWDAWPNAAIRQWALIS